MRNVPENLRIIEDADRIILSSVWDISGQWLSNSRFPHFTDHSINHSTRIVGIVSSLIEMGKIELSNDERFVLMAAIALHDIGMQTNRYIPNSKFPLDKEELEVIRDNHHVFSKDLIIESYKELGLHQKHGLVDYIAEVAMNHRGDGLEDIADAYISGKKMRLKLLSALLQLGDCLDFDFNRVHIDILPQFNIEIKSVSFWFCHYYVQSVRIERGKIEVDFRFPLSYKGTNIESAVKKFVLSEMKNQASKLFDLFSDYGIIFHRDIIGSKAEYLNVLECMPEEVIDFVLSNLNEEYSFSEEEAFIAYQKRSNAIDSILSLINTIGDSKFLCFFGGISSKKLCVKSAIDKMSAWLRLNPDAVLFICYEVGEAAESRAKLLSVANPHQHMQEKTNIVIASQDLFSEDVKNRVCFIQINTPLNRYTIILDDDFYWTPLTNERSSDTTTLQAKDTPAGNKARNENINYILTILSKTEPSDSVETFKTAISSMFTTANY